MKIKRLNIGIFKAMKLCRDYSSMPQQKRDKLREERLRNIVAWAREKSPYYAQLYKDIGNDFSLADLPPVSKREMMDNWDSWVTDRDVKLEQIRSFMEDKDNIGRKWRGKYMIFTTSGSTGEPLVALCDDTTNGVMGGINACRAYARKEDLKAFMKRGAKTIGVFADSGFYLGNSSVRSRLLKMPWKKKQMAISSALLPVETIVKQLNEFQPAMLGGYPTNLELLIEEQKSGRLNISPVVIMTGGEYLSDKLRKELSETFGCYVQTSYSCTEGGSVACECTEQHFHINDDWVIVEAVDKNNQPVPDGVQSDKILLTNLFNYTQPYIRYEVSDRIVMHHEKCACGNPSPWIELEGRTDDVITLAAGDGEIRIPPLALTAALKEVHELRRFQLLVHTKESAEIRIVPADGVSMDSAFEAAKSAMSELVESYGADMPILNLSSEKPQQHPKSGKFKHIINLSKDENK